LLLVLLGIAFIVVFGMLDLPPTSPAPFIRSREGQCWFFTAVAVYLVATGVGLARRSRIAWLGFSVYFALGTVYIVLGAIFDPRPNDPHWAYLSAFAVIVNGLFAFGLYALTRQVFAIPRMNANP